MEVLLKFSDGTLKQDGSGETPIHAAVKHDNTKCLELLIAKTQSTYLRVENMLGDKPRDIAEKKRRTKCIEILLSVKFSKPGARADRRAPTAVSFGSLSPKTSFDANPADLSRVYVPTSKTSDISDITSFSSDNIFPFFETRGETSTAQTGTGELCGVLAEYLPIAGKVFKLVGAILSFVDTKGKNDELCIQFEQRYSVLKLIIKDNCKRRMDQTKFSAIQHLATVLCSLQQLISDHTARTSFAQIFTSKSFKKEYTRLDDMVSKHLHVLQVGMSSEILERVANLNTSFASLLEKMNSWDGLVRAAGNRAQIDSVTEDGAIEIPVDKIRKYSKSPVAS